MSRPRTTKPEPGHKIHPYLLRGMEITRPNQVWAMDITYIPMARGRGDGRGPFSDVYAAVWFNVS
jgi:transposase InsO family protein